MLVLLLYLSSMSWMQCCKDSQSCITALCMPPGLWLTEQLVKHSSLQQHSTGMPASVTAEILNLQFCAVVSDMMCWVVTLQQLTLALRRQHWAMH